jgi:cytochrome b561
MDVQRAGEAEGGGLGVRLANSENRYGAVAQGLHWIIAALFAVQFALAWYMDDLPIGPHKVEMYNLHKSFGLVVLLLAAIRLAWRLRNPAPPWPEHMADWEKRAARASHILLYAVLFVQPVSGLIMALAAEFPTTVFGLFNLPDPLGTVEWLKDAMLAVHWWGSWFVLALIAVHVAAALRHHFWLRDDVLKRMLPGSR